MTFKEVILAVICGIYLLGCFMFIIGGEFITIMDFIHKSTKDNRQHYFKTITGPDIVLCLLQGLIWPFTVTVWIFAKINGDL